MNFTVIWSEAALENLAPLWAVADSSEREKINGVVEDLDHRLARDARQIGESREGRRRICFDPPFAVSLLCQ